MTAPQAAFVVPVFESAAEPKALGNARKQVDIPHDTRASLEAPAGCGDRQPKPQLPTFRIAAPLSSQGYTPPAL